MSWLTSLFTPGRSKEKAEEEQIMKVIVGLGNPGTKYAGSRHNMGFAVIDVLAERHGIRVNTLRYKALCGSGIIAGQKVLLVKPQTYMNNSGESVRPVSDFYKMDPEDILVIYDDISLDIGQIRVRGKGSAGGHNGMKSIISHLGCQTFPRVRVGVGDKPAQMDLADYVLGHFAAGDLPAVRDSFQRAADAAETWVASGVDGGMTRFNAFERAPK